MLLILFRFLSYWPLAWLQAAGAVLGWLVYALSPTYRQRLRTHATQAGVPSKQWRGAVASAGRMVCELPYLWLRPAQKTALSLVRFEHESLVSSALAQGRGVLLLTPHLGCFEIAAQAIAERFGHEQPLTVLYRPARQAWLQNLLKTARERPHLLVAPASLAGVRQMIRALRQGQMVGLLPDQVPPQGMGVWAPFFGQPAYTMTLASRLVQQTGATVVLTWVQRLPQGRGYVQRFSEFRHDLMQEPEANAQRINQAMQDLILQCPEQYLWGYHRYKAPRGEA